MAWSSSTFSKLDLFEKAEIINLNGSYVTSRVTSDTIIVLYSINKLFVELVYEKETNVVFKIEVIPFDELSAIYLNGIIVE